MPGRVIIPEKGTVMGSGLRIASMSAESLLYRPAGNLRPSCFALVMATGVVSMAAHDQQVYFISIPLYWFNQLAYLFLWILTLLRLLLFGEDFLADFVSHQKGPSFFTIVAASGVLGGQILLIGNSVAWAFILWVVTFLLWCCLTYTIFTALVIKDHKPSIEKGIDGSWLLPIVATQAVAVLSGLLVPYSGVYREAFVLTGLAMWLFGGMLYIWTITLIFYRYTFFHFSPGDLTPPYWINMGAVAITTLGGTVLIRDSGDSFFINSILPFLKGFTFFFWATATWWIPMLIILSLWRHAYRKVAMAYDPLFWGAVFPLGMYAVSTHRLAQFDGLSVMVTISRIFLYLAIAAWASTFLGMFYALLFSRRPLSIGKSDGAT